MEPRKMTCIVAFGLLALIATPTLGLCEPEPPRIPELLEASVVPVSEQVSDFEARREMARLLSYHEDTLEQALEQYEILVAQEPPNSALLFERAEILFRLGRKDHAEHAFTELLNLSLSEDQQQTVYFRLGQFKLWRKAYAQAIDLLARVLPSSRLYAQAQRELARAEVGLSQYSAAIERYAALIGQGSNDSSLYMELGDASLYAGDVVGAVGQYQSGYRLDSENLILVKKLGLALSWSGKKDEAYPYLKRAYEHDPADREVALELSRGLLEKSDSLLGQAILQDLLERFPDDKEILIQLAALEARLGHPAESLKWIEKLLVRDDLGLKEELEVAGLFNLWGDFYRVESVYLALLSEYPGDNEIKLKLAELYLSQDRYFEAEGIFKLVLHSKNESLESRAKAGAARACAKLDRSDCADKLLEHALELNSGTKIAKYRASIAQGEGSQELLDEILTAEASTPTELVEWAGVFGAHGQQDAAEALYRTALTVDPQHFPAQIGLAQALARRHNFSESLVLFERLESEFPGNRKILIEHARALAWSKDYEEAISRYEELHELMPSDPVPVLEMARVAFWAKDIRRAEKSYEVLLQEPVDRQLAVRLSQICKPSECPGLDAAISRLKQQADSGSIWQGYSEFATRQRFASETGRDTALDLPLIELEPAYRIQKTASLELRAKKLFWHKQFSRAADAFNELIEEDPSNQEAWFDMAQTQCAQGLCQDADETYRRLLAIDPFHSLAPLAIENADARANPLVSLREGLWSEEGRGELSGITRSRTDLEFNLPVDRKYSFGLNGVHWNERPEFTSKSYRANGLELRAAGVFNQYVSGSAGWIRKAYDDDYLDDTNTGFADLGVNVQDYLKLGLRFERTDELYNFFGLQQGLQADAWTARAASDVTRNLEVLGKASKYDYNDTNSAEQFSLGAGYAFTDHPRILKFTGVLEYKDTDEDNLYIYDQSGRLQDIVHPYWAPQEYWSAIATLEWYQDLSPIFFCGADLHYYDLKLSVDTNTEHNPGLQLEAAWHHELTKRWQLDAKGLWHTSPDWDAVGLWLGLGYRF